MSRTPYSPFVLKATAPDPWNVARWFRGRSSSSAGFPGVVAARGAVALGNPTFFVGISLDRAPGSVNEAKGTVPTRGVAAFRAARLLIRGTVRQNGHCAAGRRANQEGPGCRYGRSTPPG